jgi:hypothetical protein
VLGPAAHGRFVHVSCLALDCPGRPSEALGVDVDDGREAVAAHRLRCRGEEAAGSLGEAARGLRLRDELGAISAAQAQARRRAEEVAARAF